MNINGTVPFSKDQSTQERTQDFGRPLQKPCRKRVARALFAGNFFTNSTTSAYEIGVNSRSSQPIGTGVKVGKSAPAVDARTPATLSLKKRCNVEASISDDGGARPRPSSSSKDRQRRHWSTFTRFVQKSKRFCYSAPYKCTVLTYLLTKY